MSFLLPLLPEIGELGAAGAETGAATAGSEAGAGASDALSERQFNGAPEPESPKEPQPKEDKKPGPLDSLDPKKAAEDVTATVTHNDWPDVDQVGRSVAQVMQPKQFG